MINDTLFGLIAAKFPTHRMGQNKTLAAFWRIPYYLLHPSEPFVMRTRDYRLYVYPRKGTLTRAVIRRGYWELLETEIFINLLTPGALIIDAGANFGHYSLTAAGLVGANGLVIGFEPHPETYAMLAANRGLLPYENFIAVEAGLGASDGTIDLYTDLGNPGGHSNYEWNRRDRAGNSCPVDIVSLDSYLSKRDDDRPVSVIKIDVQGAEMDVLRGAARTIEGDRPAVLCEVTPDALTGAGSGVEELLEFFSARDYRAEVIFPDTGKTEPMDYPRSLAFFARSDAEYHDVLFRPSAPSASNSQ
jgi:FkbM family methyltransferase